MELRDFIVTPIILFLVYAGAYVVRPWVTDEVNRKYFFPALTLRIVGALALGFLYQFYYGGGDTFNYHTHGSRVIWEIFTESPLDGVKIFFSQGTFGPGTWDISDKIWYWRDPHSFTIIQIAFVFDLLTFSSYSATAILFSILSFTGAWMLFLTFYNKHRAAHRLLSLSCLFIPSVIFWGSGILKDTVTLAFIGMSTYFFSKIFIDRKIRMRYILLLLLSLFVIFFIKKYILISFLAGVIVWLTSVYFFKVQSKIKRFLLVPFVVFTCGILVYYVVNMVVEDDPRYSLDKLAETAKITAYDIRYGWGKDGGSGYSLGELDGSLGTMLKLAPKAINVSLFRPYLWEVRSPIMLLSAVESLLALILALYVLMKVKSKLMKYVNGEVVFCFVFVFVFAVGVGVSAYNFGTLARYKIPLLPFYFTSLSLIYHYWKRDRKVAELEITEY